MAVFNSNSQSVRGGLSCSVEWNWRVDTESLLASVNVLRVFLVFGGETYSRKGEQSPPSDGGYAVFARI